MTCFWGVVHTGGSRGRSGVTDAAEGLLARSSVPENTNSIFYVMQYYIYIHQIN